MSPGVTSHEQHTHRILTELEAGNGISQRSLSRNVGIALGLTNLLIRRLVRKGWVRVIHIKPNRVKYLLTPTGIAEKTRMSRQALQNSVRFYLDARDRIHERFSTLSAEWPPDANGLEGAGAKRIVFYGAGEVAEIGYICLHGTDLSLVGVVDDKKEDREPERSFFGLPVQGVGDLALGGPDLPSFDRLVVMSFGDPEGTRARLQKVGFPPERVFWI